MQHHKSADTIAYQEGCSTAGITRAETVRERIAVAGYVADHAPTHAEGQRIATIASRMRSFDRSGGKFLLV